MSFHFKNTCQDLITEDRQIKNAARWNRPANINFNSFDEDVIPQLSINKVFHPSAIHLKNKDYLLELTSKQWEILKLYAQGQTVKQIASGFKRSPRTIETTLSRIKEKSGCARKIELINFFRDNNFSGV